MCSTIVPAKIIAISYDSCKGNCNASKQWSIIILNYIYASLFSKKSNTHFLPSSLKYFRKKELPV